MLFMPVGELRIPALAEELTAKCQDTIPVN